MPIMSIGWAKYSIVLKISVSILLGTFDHVTASLSCRDHNLVRYRITFQGLWSEDSFPKHYPKGSRPHAQWSKLIGRSHDGRYTLWSEGSLSSTAFKKFAQEGNSDFLDKLEAQGFEGVLDSFSAPPLNQGVGESTVDCFISSKQHMISVAVRLVPSPDWFVGVDGLKLCSNDSWLTDATVDLNPMDCGVDQGYTFTAPKWASKPQQKIFRITSNYPNHSANSFYYPDSERLPNIASLKFKLIADYEMHKTYIDEIDNEKMVPKISPGPNGPSPNQEAKQVEKEIQEKAELDDSDEWEDVPDDNEDGPALLYGSLKSKKKDRKNKKPTKKRHNLIKYKRLKGRKSRDHVPSLATNQESKNGATQGCQFGDWAEWSTCSKLCGLGLQKRERLVLKRSHVCSDQEEQRICRGRCTKNSNKPFSWLDKLKNETKRYRH